MEKLEKLYEGKAKQLYATDDPEVLWVEYKNSATAGDGEKKEDFAGKGRLNNLITTLIFDLLKKRGIDSHLVARVGETSQLVKKVTMFPLEIVLRNTAAGHFCSRLGVEEGIELKEPVLEYFLKNDDLHDPFVNDDDLVALDVCTRKDLAEIAPLARRINEALIEIFAQDRRQAGRFQDRDGPHLRRHAAARRRDHAGFLPSVGSARPFRQGGAS